jgi:hydroxyethylthiazole kinase
LLINLGTLDRERREAAGIAVEVASGKRTPWVLDPVFVERSQSRAEFAKTLIAMTPGAIRLNGAEFAAIAGSDPAPDALARYALGQHCVVALTGATDVVTDGARKASIENGAALMGQVTAMGCAGTALIAACLAVEPDAWLAVSSALLAFAVAGECAAVRARGPGSMAFELLDSLAELDPDTLLARARVR